MIKVIGLGYGDGDVSLRGAAAIDDADTVIVKTALNDTYKLFEDIEHITCDAIYEASENFNELNEALASFVIEREKGTTVYCVGGSGIDDRSVILLKTLRPDVEIIPGASTESRALADMPTTEFTAVSAYDLNVNFYYDSVNCNFVIKDIDSQYIAGEVKEYLTRKIGEETKLSFVTGGIKKEIFVYELDRQPFYDYSSYAAAAPQPLLNKAVYSYDDLIAIMRRLTADDGCEWDKAQTHESLRNNVIEEAFELVDAINGGDPDDIIEESGDVILQGVFHAVLGDIDGEFLSEEVLTALCRKLIRRHPHVFGDVRADNSEEALASWTAAKAIEKKAKTPAEKLFRIAKALPSLMRAEKIQKIAEDAGIDIGSLDDKLPQLLSALDEMADNEEAWGLLLFAAVLAMKKKGLKAEPSLAGVNERITNAIITLLDNNVRR